MLQIIVPEHFAVVLIPSYLFICQNANSRELEMILMLVSKG